MKKTIKIIVWTVVIACSLFGVTKFYQFMTPAAGSGDQQQTGSEVAPLVQVVEITRGDIKISTPVIGTIEADASARVVPEVSGVLETFRLADGTPVEEGLEVQKGDLLGIVEHEELKASLEEARAGLKVAEFSLKEARVQLDDARREKKRMVALFEEGTATEQQRDKALTAYESAVARVELAEKRVEQARAALKKAQVLYDEATIEAPISGVISQKYVDEGSYVDPNTALVKILDINHVEVEGSVAGKYFPILVPGQTQALVEVDAYPGETFRGKVDRVRPELDPQTRTVKVTVRIPNQGLKLKPGMFARIELILKERKNVIVAPDVAIADENGHFTVYLVNSGKVHKRRVKIGLEQGPRNEILSGLSEGDLVVIRGRHLLSDGMEVRIERGAQ